MSFSSLSMSFERTQIVIPSSFFTGTQPISIAVTSAAISSSGATYTKYGDSTSFETHDAVTFHVLFFMFLSSVTSDPRTHRGLVLLRPSSWPHCETVPCSKVRRGILVIVAVSELLLLDRRCAMPACVVVGGSSHLDCR